MARKNPAVKVGTDTSMDDVIDGINKQFGTGSLRILSADNIEPIEVIPTGILELDLALGVGGLGRGRIVEIYGPESSGKSTIALHAIAEAQKLGHWAAYVDAEHAFDPIYAQNVGVDLDRLLFSQPDTGEEGLEIVSRLSQAGTVALIVVDSVAALTPRAEIEGEIGDSHVGLHARLMSQSLRIITAAASRTETTVFFINQLREKIGVMYGSPEITTGGKSLKFYASVRMDIRRTKTTTSGSGENAEATGSRTKVKVVKNKLAAPFRVAEFDIEYGVGAPRANSVLNMALQHGIAQSKGAWIYIEGEQYANGRAKALEKLASDSATMEYLASKVTELVRGGPLFVTENVEDGAE